MHRFKKVFPVFWVIGVFVLASCDSKTEKTNHVELNAEELGWLTPHLAGVQYKKVHSIPVESLSQTDRDMGNTTFWSLYDGQKTLLGYSRQIGDPLDCSSGKCKAIRFFLLFNPNLDYMKVFHPTGRSGDFYKGIEGDPDGDELFSADDWQLLHELLMDPPALLLEAESSAQIVDAVSTATFEEYWDVVVRQAAYTTYRVIWHMITSRELIQAQVL